ncbi:TonB-dependent receptor [Simiduia agarivorans]|uniref:TonB-dependent receptor n=1 Tax=Simiduia agarivorans (strain DSM 21679 / JCM 13881 / BCRC 17597 / SA1) TaxID=1117647 RepID=K4KPE3_SIMAS|nr:TonB-dependent receptor [Simiduia agarivorans]AFU99988.1 TonB-dependent receptor [Simiduia agarivorans SA1 = DSM 21679]
MFALKKRALRLSIIAAGFASLPLHAAIEEVIVTASPFDKTGDTLTQPASVLTGDELRRQASATLGDALKQEPGITSASFGPGVGAPVIRGQSANRVKVMQDHLGTGDVANSSPDHANTVEPLLAERIEVLRGPAVLRYGNDAIGGVVNVIDNRIPSAPIDGIEGAGEVRYQSVNEQQAGVAFLQGGNGTWAWHVNGLALGADEMRIPGEAHHPSVHDEEEGEEEISGLVENTDMESSNYSLGGSFHYDQGFIGLAFSQADNNYGIPPGAHVHHDEHEEEHEEEEEHHEEEHGEEFIRIDMQQTRYDLKGEHRMQDSWAEKLTYRLGYTDYEHAELEGDEIGTRFINKAWEGRAELVHRTSEQMRGAVGLQYQTRDYSALGEEAFIPKSDISNAGLFALQEYTTGDWVLELGLRGEWAEVAPQGHIERDFSTLSASGAAHWHLSDASHLTFGIARAQRAPAVEELFANGPHLAEQNYIRGNENLDPETSNNFELAYHYEGPLHVQVNLFNNQISDFIYKANTGEEEDELPVYQYTQEDARFYGAEASVGLPFAGNWEVSLFGDSVRAKLDNGGDVPRITPPRVGLALAYADELWNAELRTTQVDKQRHPGEEELAVDGYTRVDLTASRNFNLGANQDLLVFLRGKNLTNEEIRNATSFLRAYAPEPGRSLELGLRFSF